MSLRVFVTGASGYVGTAVAARIARSGATVFGLTRDATRDSSLAASGVQPVAGDLDRPEAFLAEMKNCDAVVHAAFDAADAARGDQSALEAIRVAVQDGRVRRVVYTSGVWVYGDTAGRIVDESSPLDPAGAARWRPAHEEVALDLSAHDARVVILRPGLVYGGGGGIFGDWFRQAKEQRVVGIPGEGTQRWTVVHREDVAEAYRLALEHGKPGERYLIVDESRFTVKELAAAVARATGAATRPIPPEELVARGPDGAALLLDQQATAAKARRELGWVPRHASFVDEADDLYGEWLAERQGTPV